MAGYALGFLSRNPEDGLAYVRRAIAINPSSARSHDHLGWLLLYAGNKEEALLHFNIALKLCPIDEFAFRMLAGRGFAYLFSGDFKSAVKDGRRALAASPSYSVAHRVLAAALAQAGKTRESAKVISSLGQINPNLSLSNYMRETRMDDPKDRDILFQGLKRAGMG